MVKIVVKFIIFLHAHVFWNSDLSGRGKVWGDETFCWMQFSELARNERNEFHIQHIFQFCRIYELRNISLIQLCTKRERVQNMEYFLHSV